MTNPKAALVRVAIAVLGLKPGAALCIRAFVATGMCLMSLGTHTIYAIVFSALAIVRIYGRARRHPQAMFGVLFAFAANKMLTSGEIVLGNGVFPAVNCHIVF